MARYKDLKLRIEKKYSELPKNQKKIAEYFLLNFDSIPFMNVQELSDKNSVSVASIVRFAQSIGFTGYSELREEISHFLHNDISGKKELFPRINSSMLKDDTLSLVANLDIKNINDTLLLIEREKFSNAIKLLSGAKKVYTAGLGISFLMAEILAYQLTQVGIDASPLRHNWCSFLEQLVNLKKEDLLVVFSFPPYSKETIDAAEYAKTGGSKIIAITNKSTAPAAQISDEALIVNSENMLYTNSFAAISVLINAIATECALKDKTRAKKMMQTLTEISDNQNNFVY
ncbi:MAG: MurR/RpiR family transcriptional regulator [Ignavibacteriaceae bacterium]|nr:MurR/RpiR family transcriptional regulator [Ignavibacteriaceae bacterium]